MYYTLETKRYEKYQKACAASPLLFHQIIFLTDIFENLGDFFAHFLEALQIPEKFSKLCRHFGITEKVIFYRTDFLNLRRMTTMKNIAHTFQIFNST